MSKINKDVRRQMVQSSQSWQAFNKSNILQRLADYFAVSETVIEFAHGKNDILPVYLDNLSNSILDDLKKELDNAK